MMWEDPIVKDVRAVREALMQKFDHDLDRMLKYFQEHYPHATPESIRREPKRPSQKRTGVAESS